MAGKSSGAGINPRSGHKRLRILMTEGTSLSARQTLFALGSRHLIDVTDPAPLCQCRFSRYVRKWYRCPPYARQPTAFLDYLARRLESDQYDVLLPTHEQVYLLSRFRETLSRYVGLALPEFSALERMHNKAAFMRLLDELHLPHPQTDLYDSFEDLRPPRSFPCYVKFAHSTAGCGVHYVQDQDRWPRVVERLGARDDNDDCEVLVQQPARGVQSTVQAVFQQGRLVGIHCFEARALGVGGMSTARVSASHPIVVDHVARLGAHLGWHGAAFIDYFYDRTTHRPEYIEANPRIGETVNAMLSGVNLCDRWLRVSLGERMGTVERPTTEPGLRTQSFYMIMISEALAGAGRWRLIGELWRKWRRLGLYANSEDELTRPDEDYLSLLPALWISLQLLAAPRLSRSIVASTIDNYSLPVAGSHLIGRLPPDTLDQIMGRP